MPGTDGGTSGFDPRFDPRFQPGYRSGGGIAPGRSPIHPEPGIEITPLRDAGAAVVPAAGQATAPRRGLEDAGYREHPDDDPRDDDDDDDDVGASLRNPFVLALWAIGAALVVGGIVAFGFARTYGDSVITSNTASPFDYALAQALPTIAVQVLLAGVATVVALLFFHALRHDRDLRSRAARAHRSASGT